MAKIPLQFTFFSKSPLAFKKVIICYNFGQFWNSNTLHQRFNFGCGPVGISFAFSYILHDYSSPVKILSITFDWSRNEKNERARDKKRKQRIWVCTKVTWWVPVTFYRWLVVNRFSFVNSNNSSRIICLLTPIARFPMTPNLQT